MSLAVYILFSSSEQLRVLDFAAAYGIGFYLRANQQNLLH